METLSLQALPPDGLLCLQPEHPPSQGFVLPQLFFTTRQRTQTRKLGLHEAFLEVVSLLKPSKTSPGV